MRALVVAGCRASTDAVASALADRFTVEELPDLAEALDQCRQSEVRLLVLVWPEAGIAVERLSRLLDRSDLPCPVLALIPPERLAERRVLTRCGLRYLPVPVDQEELLLLVDRLDSGRTRARVWLGDVCIDSNLREVRRAGLRVRLTRKEYDLLDHFQRNRGIVLSKEHLLDALWGSQVYNPNVVEVAVSGLRRKLERFGPRLVHTVHGVGYVCQADGEGAPPLQGLMERRRSLLADRQRLLAERDAIVARARTLQVPIEDDLGTGSARSNETAP